MAEPPDPRMTGVATPARAAHLPLLALCGCALLAAVWLVQSHAPLGRVFVPVAMLTAQLTAAMLEPIGVTVTRTVTTLIHEGGFACEIDLACTALLPAALLVTVLAGWRARPHVLVLGALIMVLVNQLRLAGLVWIGIHAPGQFDLAHGVAGPLLLVLAGIGYVVWWRRATRH